MTSSTIICSKLRSMASRSAGPCSGPRNGPRRRRRQDCVDWLDGQFVPSRLVLAASGKVDPDEMLMLAERLFGDMTSATHQQSSRAHFTGGIRNDCRSFEQAHWCLAFPGRPAADPRNPALALFVQALGGGTSSRLFQELREERGLAYSIYAWSQASPNRPGRDRLRGRAAAGCGIGPACARRARRDRRGLTEAELNRARAQVEAGLLMRWKHRRAAPTIWRARSRCSAGSCRSTRCSSRSRGHVDEARAAGAAMLEGPSAVASVGAKLALAA